MKMLATLGSLAIACSAGAASADIGFHIGSGLSLGFCGSGFSISSGLYLGSSYGYNGYRSSYYPSIGWYDSGSCGSYRPSYYNPGYNPSYNRGYNNRRNYNRGYNPGWNNYNYNYTRPRGYRSSRSDYWCDTEISSPLPDGVIATQDRKPNRTPVIKDEVKSEDRIADAWELLEQGHANRAQGFFALAAAKAPDDAVAKLGFALASAQLDDNGRAAWSAKRAIAVDDGELADLELGDSTSVILADLLGEWQRSDGALAVGLEAAMPGVVSQSVIALGNE